MKESLLVLCGNKIRQSMHDFFDKLQYSDVISFDIRKGLYNGYFLNHAANGYKMREICSVVCANSNTFLTKQNTVRT